MTVSMINLSIQARNETQNISFDCDDEFVRIGVDFEATLGKG